MNKIDHKKVEQNSMINQVKEIMALVNTSDIMYVSWQTADMTVTISKREQPDIIQSSIDPLTVSVNEKDLSTQSIIQQESIVNQSVVKEEQHVTKQTVDSPLVGVVYLAPAPDQPVYKKVGEAVASGDVLCIVEAMKIMNEIKSDVSGTLKEILVDNQTIVEYGQPLFVIE